MQTSESGTPTVTDDSNLKAEGGNWRDSLPDQLKDAPYFKNPDATPEQVRADIDGAAFWQGNSILKPGPDASDEAKQANLQKVMELYPDLLAMPAPDSDDYSSLFGKLGRPDDANGYKLPEGVEMDKAEAESLQQVALKANMTAKQFSDYIAGLHALRTDAASVADQARQDDIAALTREWGDAKEARLNEISQFLSDAPPQLKDIGNMDSATLKWLYEKAQAGEEGAELTGQESASTGITPAEGRERAHEYRERLLGMRPTDPLYAPLIQKMVAAEAAAMAG